MVTFEQKYDLRCVALWKKDPGEGSNKSKEWQTVFNWVHWGFGETTDVSEGKIKDIHEGHSKDIGFHKKK